MDLQLILVILLFVLAIVYAGIELIKYFTAGRKINLNTDRIEEILTSLKNGNPKN